MRLHSKSSLHGFFVSVSCSLLLMSGIAKAELPQISDARIIQPPPGANVAAAYFTLTNPGKDTLTIFGVQSAGSEKTELHLSKVENDVAKMIKQDQLTIDGGESLKFMQGGYHVMFMGLRVPLKSGDTLDLVLQTSSGNLPFSIPIMSADEASKMSHGSNDNPEAVKHDMKIDHSTHTK